MTKECLYVHLNLTIEKTHPTLFLSMKIFNDVNELEKDVFKKPSLPVSAPRGTAENNDILVPEHSRLTENQANDKELADDLKYYLDGIKDETDINLRNDSYYEFHSYFLTKWTISAHHILFRTIMSLKQSIIRPRFCSKMFG